MTAYWLGFLTGLAVLPALALVGVAAGAVSHGYWSPIDYGSGCDACRQFPMRQWSPVWRCPRCGDRHVRLYLLRLIGVDRCRAWVARGPHDEAWLNGKSR